jgi:hypothetical protein
LKQKTSRQKKMPQKFAGAVAEIKPFATWAHKVVTNPAAKWRNLRRTLREESTPVPGERRKASQTFLAEMHRQFPSMSGCKTDISCLEQLFEAFVNMLDLNEPRLVKGMRAVNKIIPLMYVTESQAGAYRTFVYQLTPIVKKRYGAKKFNKNWKNFLQPAGGSESATEAYAFKVAAEEKAAEALNYRQNHKIPVTEAAIVTAIRRWGESDDLAELFLFAQIMTGSRKSEIMLPTVSNFEHEVSLIYGYLVMWGTAKEKGSYPELAAVEPDEGEVVDDLKVDDSGAPHGWSLRRRVENPILRIAKNPATLERYTVADVLRAVVRICFPSADRFKDNVPVYEDVFADLLSSQKSRKRYAKQLASASVEVSKEGIMVWSSDILTKLLAYSIVEQTTDFEYAFRRLAKHAGYSFIEDAVDSDPNLEIVAEFEEAKTKVRNDELEIVNDVRDRICALDRIPPGGFAGEDADSEIDEIAQQLTPGEGAELAMEDVFRRVRSQYASSDDKWMADIYTAMKSIKPQAWAQLECYQIHELRDPGNRLMLRRSVMVIEEDETRYGLDASAMKYAAMPETVKLTSKFFVHLEEAVKAAGFEGITDYETSVSADLMTDIVTGLCGKACAADGRRKRRNVAKKESTRASAALNAELAMVGRTLVSRRSGRGSGRAMHYQIALTQTLGPKRTIPSDLLLSLIDTADEETEVQTFMADILALLRPKPNSAENMQDVEIGIENSSERVDGFVPYIPPAAGRAAPATTLTRDDLVVAMGLEPEEVKDAACDNGEGLVLRIIDRVDDFDLVSAECTTKRSLSLGLTGSHGPSTKRRRVNL